MVRPVQDSDIPEASDLPAVVFPCFPVGLQHADAARHTPDLLCDKNIFRQGARRLHDTHRHIIRAVGAQPFPSAHNRLCRCQDLRRGAVILLQPDHFKVRIILCQFFEALRVRPAETIDRLVRIPDHKKLLSEAVPDLYQTALDRIDILEFIHKKITKTLLPPGLYISALDQLCGTEEEIVKIVQLLLCL